jgi:hypothetical protein
MMPGQYEARIQFKAGKKLSYLVMEVLCGQTRDCLCSCFMD